VVNICRQITSRQMADMNRSVGVRKSGG